jgi:hypothetical protein
MKNRYYIWLGTKLRYSCYSKTTLKKRVGTNKSLNTEYTYDVKSLLILLSLSRKLVGC